MSRTLKYVFLTAFSILITTGCYQVSEYSGDGHLTDNGPKAATDRYVLNLGPIDLKQRGTKTFRIKNLPESSFVAGIELSVNSENLAAITDKKVTPTISLQLLEVETGVIFAKESQLVTWTWSRLANESRAFIYGRSDQGTYFHPRPDTEYELSIRVLEPDNSQVTYSALLLAKSGGWK